MCALFRCDKWQRNVHTAKQTFIRSGKKQRGDKRREKKKWEKICNVIIIRRLHRCTYCGVNWKFMCSSGNRLRYAHRSMSTIATRVHGTVDSRWSRSWHYNNYLVCKRGADVSAFCLIIIIGLFIFHYSTYVRLHLWHCRQINSSFVQHLPPSYSKSRKMLKKLIQLFISSQIFNYLWPVQYFATIKCFDSAFEWKR